MGPFLLCARQRVSQTGGPLGPPLGGGPPGRSRRTGGPAHFLLQLSHNNSYIQLGCAPLPSRDLRRSMRNVSGFLDAFGLCSRRRATFRRSETRRPGRPARAPDHPFGRIHPIQVYENLRS